MSSCKKTTRSIRNLLFGSPHKQLVKIKQPIPLQTYFRKSYKKALVAKKLGDQPADDSTAKLHVPISLIAHAKSGSTHTYVGIYEDEMHFSASLLKAGVMFAAFKLLSEAEALATAPPPPGGFSNQNAFFNTLKQQFHSSDAVPAIRNAGAGLVPRYADILKVTGFGGGGAVLTVKFLPEFYHSILEDRALYQAYLDVRTAENLGEDADGNLIENAHSLAALRKVSHMYMMIVWSNNTSAGECIRRLGYAYINIKLMEVGLFEQDPDHPKGIWIGGDYAGIFPRVEIDSVNDGKVALATTAKHMAELFSRVKLGTLPHSDGMEGLFREAEDSESSWLTRGDDRLFDVEGVKVGVANIKPNTNPKGPNVYSEGIICKWITAGALPDEKLPKDRDLNGNFAACWQNLRADVINHDRAAHHVSNQFDGIAEVIEEAVEDFLNQTAV